MEREALLHNFGGVLQRAACPRHAAVQLHSGQDCSCLLVRGCEAEHPAPRPVRGGLEPQEGRKLQIGIDRGFFYVWANKVGTARDAEGNLCVAGNYAPVWTDECFRYQVLGAWPEKLWKQRKLATDTYKEYLFLTRDGVVSRKRNLDAVEQAEERLELAEIIADNTHVRED